MEILIIITISYFLGYSVGKYNQMVRYNKKLKELKEIIHQNQKEIKL